MGALLGINPVTIGHAIAETRLLLDERKISITPAVVRYFTRAEDIRDWLNGTGPQNQDAVKPSQHALTNPMLTGMTRPQLTTLLEDLIVPYAAVIEQRRHRQRGGRRQPGTRGGVFRQKITDGDRILATILYQRRICGLDTLAELFAISRSTLWNAINDVQPILDARHVIVPPAEQRFATTAELLSAVETGHTARDSSSRTEPAC